MKPKIEAALQRMLRKLGQNELLTVLVKTDDTEAVVSYLETTGSQIDGAVKFDVKPLLKVIILSAPKEVIEQVVERDDVSYVSSNKVVTVRGS